MEREEEKDWKTIIDVLINNAGTVTKAPTLGSTQAEYLRKEFDTHCVSALSTVKDSLDALKQSPQANYHQYKLSSWLNENSIRAEN